jgi:RNA polymerase sigma-70 factor (ECF subfamily)
MPQGDEPQGEGVIRDLRSNDQWLFDLGSPGPAQDAALADLRAILRRGLPCAISRWISPSDPRLDALADEAVQEALLKILESLKTFEGRSRFTTWAHKIAVRVALTELRRKRWQDVALEALGGEGEDAAELRRRPDPVAAPERSAVKSDLMTRLQRVIQDELTERQRQAMVAVGVHGMPMDEVARRMGTNRNALYKLRHDARLRLKKRLAQEGLTPQDLLSAFAAG